MLLNVLYLNINTSNFINVQCVLFTFSEAKVYACFVKLMDKMEHNFPHGNQMDSHLANINSLVQVINLNSKL